MSANGQQQLPPIPGAEIRAVIGSAMRSRACAEYATERLVTSDVVLGPLGRKELSCRIFEVITEAIVEEGDLGPDVIRERLGASAAEFDYFGESVPWAQFKAAVDTVADLGWRRRVFVAGEKLAKRAFDPNVSIAETVERFSAHFENLVPLDHSEPPEDVIDFAKENHEYRWLVPWWMERGDRAIITGGEGSGKSLYSRQLALMLGLGIHPYTFEPCDPVRVLIVDCENSRAQAGRSLDRLLNRAPSPAKDLLPGMVRISIQPQGLDLRTQAHCRWLESKIRAAAADVVNIGPLYKLMMGASLKDEEPAAQVAAAIDRIRKRCDVAFIIEAHSPYGDSGDRAHWRPYGPSLWSRWPEIGFGLAKSDDFDPMTNRPFVDLKAWRPPRERPVRWPERMREGMFWPWEKVS